MVQIQSSWFPLYDRNPQTYVPNIFFAKPADYVKATQTVFRSADRPARSGCRWWRRAPGLRSSMSILHFLV